MAQMGWFNYQPETNFFLKMVFGTSRGAMVRIIFSWGSLGKMRFKTWKTMKSGQIIATSHDLTLKGS